MSSWTHQDIFYTVLEMVEGDVVDHLDALRIEHELDKDVIDAVFIELQNKLRGIER